MTWPQVSPPVNDGSACGFFLTRRRVVALIEAANQIQTIVVREVFNWAFAVSLASVVGYGRLEIDIKDHRIDRAQLVWGMKPEAPPNRK